MKEYFNKLYLGSGDNFLSIVKENLEKEKRMFIVTANPEAFMIGSRDEYMNELLMSNKTTIVADGIGLVKCASMLNINVKERITGIDLTYKLLEIANEKKYKVAIIGSKEEVIKELKTVLNKNYPNIDLIKIENGYIKDKDSFFNCIKDIDICLVGLGMPLQEKLIYKNLDKFNKGIFIGIGGSLDIISGSKKRAPKLFQKLNIEWLYRIVCEPKRLKRFYNNNIKFLFKVKKLKKGD